MCFQSKSNATLCKRRKLCPELFKHKFRYVFKELTKPTSQKEYYTPEVPGVRPEGQMRLLTFSMTRGFGFRVSASNPKHIARTTPTLKNVGRKCWPVSAFTRSSLPSLTPSVLIDTYMRHRFKCTGSGMTHICVIQSNTPGAD